MRGNQNAGFYLYNSRINDNRVIIKVQLQTVDQFKEKDNDFAITVDALIYGHFGNLKTWLSQIMVVYENWLS